MKGWTVEALESKGVKFAVTGGASAPAVAPVKRAAKKQAKREPLRASRSRPAVAEIVLDLPVPPSANGCWTNVAGLGRCRTTAYRSWHRGAAKEAAIARGRIDGAYTALIQLGSLGKLADVDNRCKPTLDMLAGLLTDDDQSCIRATSEWADDVKPRRMRVTLRSAA